MNLDPCQEWLTIQPEYLRHIEEGQSGYLKKLCLLPFVMEHLSLLPGDRLLDVGCGSGWLESILPDVDYHGLDVALPEYLVQELKFRRESLQENSFDRNFFDICVAIMVLQFIEDIDEAFGVLFRLLSPGGQLLIVIPEPYFYNTGEVGVNGNYIVKKPLGISTSFQIEIGNQLPPVTYFYRSTSKYVNSAINAGFFVNSMHETYLDTEAFYTQFGCSEISKRRSSKVPMFQLLKFVRPVSEL